MNIAQEPQLLLNLLKEHEEGIAKLYIAYSEIFSEYKSFWEELSKEEIQHAKWLNNLQAKIEDGSCCFVLERFSSAAIETSLKFVNKCLFKAYEDGFQIIKVSHFRQFLLLRFLP